jgi:hypothetical protein
MTQLMMLKSWLAGMTTILGVLALTGGAASAARFSGAYPGYNNSGSTQCYEQHVPVGCDATTGLYCDECTMQGGDWDGSDCWLYSCYQTPAYIYSTVAIAPGDVILWSDTGAFSLAQMTTNALFTTAASETLRIHAGACYGSSGSNCTSIWNSTAFLDPIVAAANACNSGHGKGKCVRALRRNIAQMLTHLTPGLLTVAPMSHPEVSGPPTIFRALDSTMKTTAINNMHSHFSNGTAFLYSLGAYSEYTPYGMCAESVRVAFGLTTSEGAGGTCIPVQYVTAIDHSLHSVFFNIVRHGKANMNGHTISLPGFSGLPGKARMLISQGGRDGVSTALANAVVNAFMNRPNAQDSNPFGTWFQPVGTVHAISNVTSPMNIYLALKNGTVSACMTSNSSGAYAGDITTDTTDPDDDARNNGTNGGSTEYGYQGEAYNFTAALSSSVVSTSLAGHCSGGQNCEADSDCWRYYGASSTCNFPSEFGRIGYWYGKVNVHQATGGAWVKDSDCSSGANIAPLTYCRKFWPSTMQATAISLSAKSSAVWNTAGCGAVYGGDGQNEYICSL